MKLIGYVKPFSPSSFTIPVYKLGKEYFVHKLNNELLIEDFVSFEFNEDDYFPLKKTLEYRKNDHGPIVYILSNNEPLIEPSNMVYYKAYELDGENIQKNPALASEFEEIKKYTKYEVLPFMEANSVDVIFDNISSNFESGIHNLLETFSNTVRNIFLVSDAVKNTRVKRLNNISVITVPSSTSTNFINDEIRECYIEMNMNLPSRLIFANKKEVNKNRESFIQFYNHHIDSQETIVAARIASNFPRFKMSNLSNKRESLLANKSSIRSAEISLLNYHSTTFVFSISVSPVVEGFNKEELADAWTVLEEIGKINEKISKKVLIKTIQTDRSDYPVTYIDFTPKGK